MKKWLRMAMLVLVLLPLPLHGEEGPEQFLMRDDAAGYVLALPPGWREVSDSRQTRELALRVCSLFTYGDSIPGASNMRAATFPDDPQAAPAMVVFALDYAALGLSEEAVKEIAKDSEAAIAALANAIQDSYLQKFPQSIMVNNHLGEDFFSLNLRSIMDPARPEASTRNQHLRMMLTMHKALILMTLYDGPPNALYDEVIATSVRETLILPEQNLQKVIPPREVSVLDYVLMGAALVAVFYVVRALRRFSRS
jgi:hypothetical protein